MESPPQYPRHVGIHGRRGALKSEARDRTCRVASYTGKTTQIDGIGGDDSVSLANDFLGQSVQVGCPPVVAQPVPALTDH
jgi:hypothetical protein